MPGEPPRQCEGMARAGFGSSPRRTSQLMPNSRWHGIQEEGPCVTHVHWAISEPSMLMIVVSITSPLWEGAQSEVIRAIWCSGSALHHNPR